MYTVATRGPAQRLDRWIPTSLLMLLGAILCAFTLEFLVTHADPRTWWRTELFVTLSIGSAVVYSGYWLARSDYEVSDLWRVLGWGVAGIAGAIVIAGGIYVQQSFEGVQLAEPTLLFEFLTLLGIAIGTLFGIVWQRRSQQSVDPSIEITEGIDTAELWEVLDDLDDETDTLRQRWTIVEQLVETSTQELPTEAFAVKLARTETFPDDVSTTQQRLVDEHLPTLVENGIVEHDETIDTIRYVGSDRTAACVSSGN